MSACDIILRHHAKILALGVALAVATVLVLTLAALPQSLSAPTFALYILLSLAFAARYLPLLRAWPLDRLRRFDWLWVFLGAAFALAILLTVRSQAMLYFGLVTLEGYLLVSSRRFALGLLWAIGTMVLAVVAHILVLWESPQPVVALLQDVPWYVLSVFIIAASKSIYDSRETALQAKLSEAYGQMQDHIARAEALAMAQERARLAREIHDTLGHTLTALDVQLELIVQLSAGSSDDCQRVARHSRALVKDGLSEVRRAVKALRPEALEALSLPEAIASLTTDFQERTHINVIFRVEGDAISVSSRLAVPLYRAAQEALTNVSRHASASEVVMTLGFEHESITLTVEDNGGSGEKRDDDGNMEFGFGLQGLHERSEALGGEFHAGPIAGGGFRVTMKLPRWFTPKRVPVEEDSPVQLERMAAEDIGDLMTLLAHE